MGPLLVAMIVPAVCARKGCLGSDSSFLSLAPNIAQPAYPTRLLSQRAGCSHPLALPASSAHTFIVVSSITSLAPLPKGSSLGTSDITLTHLPKTAQPQKDLDHSPATYEGESFKIAAKHAGGGEAPRMMTEIWQRSLPAAPVPLLIAALQGQVDSLAWLRETEAEAVLRLRRRRKRAATKTFIFSVGQFSLRRRLSADVLLAAGRSLSDHLGL